MFNSKGGLFESYLYEQNPNHFDSLSNKQVLIHSIKIEGADSLTKVKETIQKISQMNVEKKLEPMLGAYTCKKQSRVYVTEPFIG